MRVIAGRYKGRVLKTGQGPGYRPATGRVREAVFSMLEARGVRWAGCRALDLFAGSGSLAVEALSRGAAYVCLVEKSPRLAALIRDNLRDLGAPPAAWRVEARDVESFLRVPPAAPFDVVFIDPPYGHALLAPALRALLAKNWLAPAGFVLAEVEDKAALPDETALPGLELVVNKLYGQTRILLWQARASDVPPAASNSPGASEASGSPEASVSSVPEAAVSDVPAAGRSPDFPFHQDEQ